MDSAERFREIYQDISIPLFEKKLRWEAIAKDMQASEVTRACIYGALRAVASWIVYDRYGRDKILTRESLLHDVDVLLRRIARKTDPQGASISFPSNERDLQEEQLAAAGDIVEEAEIGEIVQKLLAGIGFDKADSTGQ